MEKNQNKTVDMNSDKKPTTEQASEEKEMAKVEVLGKQNKAKKEKKEEAVKLNLDQPDSSQKSNKAGDKKKSSAKQKSTANSKKKKKEPAGGSSAKSKDNAEVKFNLGEPDKTAGNKSDKEKKDGSSSSGAKKTSNSKKFSAKGQATAKSKATAKSRATSKGGSTGKSKSTTKGKSTAKDKTTAAGMKKKEEPASKSTAKSKDDAEVKLNLGDKDKTASKKSLKKKQADSSAATAKKTDAVPKKDKAAASDKPIEKKKTKTEPKGKQQGKKSQKKTSANKNQPKKSSKTTDNKQTKVMPKISDDTSTVKPKTSKGRSQSEKEQAKKSAQAVALQKETERAEKKTSPKRKPKSGERKLDWKMRKDGTVPELRGVKLFFGRMRDKIAPPKGQPKKKVVSPPVGTGAVLSGAVLIALSVLIRNGVVLWSEMTVAVVAAQLFSILGWCFIVVGNLALSKTSGTFRIGMLIALVGAGATALETVSILRIIKAGDISQVWLSFTTTGFTFLSQICMLGVLFYALKGLHGVVYKQNIHESMKQRVLLMLVLALLSLTFAPTTLLLEGALRIILGIFVVGLGFVAEMVLCFYIDSAYRDI